MAFRLDWQQLLSDERHSGGAPPSSSSENRASVTHDARTPFERDYDRIIFSAPFRRLARKTQVHTFAEMDQIHNRLTHTLEVASVGRSLGYALGRVLKDRKELPENRSIQDIVQIVQSACLAHDIGNPPFGHAGEFAIREWVKENKVKLFGDGIAARSQAIEQDWMSFEGNAQGFRMVARYRQYRWPYFTTSIPAEPGMSGGFVFLPVDGTPVAACGVVSADSFSGEACTDQMQSGNSIIACSWPALGLSIPQAIGGPDGSLSRSLLDMVRSGDVPEPLGGISHLRVISTADGTIQIEMPIR
jgi:hypothetical protein